MRCCCAPSISAPGPAKAADFAIPLRWESIDFIREHATYKERKTCSFEHDPEKWSPVFRKDHAQPIRLMQQQILIVLHQEHSTPGRIGCALQRLGYRLDVRRPRFGEPLPKTMADHAGAIIFGGPMSANDEDAFIGTEIDWIAVPMKENKPFLGICLGAQMCARQLGGKVFKHPNGHAEIGYYPIHPTAAGLTVVETWPECVYQWHREGFDVPAGAELLAEGDTFEVQAIRSGRAYALQFHPDVTHAMMHKWTTRGHDRMELPGAKPRHTHFADRAVYDYSARAWLNVFLEQWLSAT
jgi:GMP synthase (glutamine-hydrolysing)